MIRPEKVEKVNAIQEKLQESKAIILTDYKGLSVSEINSLRKTMREAGVEYRVLKNTLINLAVDKVANDELNKVKHFLSGPTAVAFSKDPVLPAKILSEFSKSNPKNLPLIKAGVIEGKICNEKEIKAIANLPSREELIAKILGSLNAPITNFVLVSSGILRSFVCVLNAIKEKKESN